MQNESKRFPNPFTVKNQRRLAWTSLAFFTLTLVYIVLFQANIIFVFFGLSAAYFTLLIPSFLSKRRTEKATQTAHEDGAIELLAKSPLPIFTYHKQDDEIRIRYTNPAIKNVSSKDISSLVNQPITCLSMPEDSEEILSACTKVMQDSQLGRGHSFFIRGKNQHDEMIKLMCFTSKINWLNQDIGICFIFDISQTENKYIEMNTHMQKGYMSALVSGIVHDFRNVLTSIIGTAEALQLGLKDQNTINQLDVIISAGERGSDTITHLLKLSSGSQDKEDIPYSDINPAIKSIVSLLRLQLPENIKLLHKTESHLPKVKLSTSQLEQILMNLVNNAAQSIKGKGVISIYVGEEFAKENKISNQRTLKLSVSDNGCGISEEELPYVTQNFWSLRKKEGGTGLGLAMVKRIVANNQGKLQILSKLSTGTQVNIFFPSQAEQAAEKASSPTYFNIAPPTKKEVTVLASPKKENAYKDHALTKVIPCTILLVDDQEDVLQVHSLLLQTMGHTILAAKSGNEALQIYSKEKEHIQMLITDFKMPGMDGVDLAEELRAQSKELALLMVTAYGETEKLQLAKDIDMTIILKPSSFKKFSDAILEIQRKQPENFS